MIEGIGQVSAVQFPGVGGDTNAKVESSQEGGFEAALQSIVSDISNQLKYAEAISIEGVQGEASRLEVVSAVMDAEQKLQAAIAIRDKVVQAYLEISRMQI